MSPLGSKQWSLAAVVAVAAVVLFWRIGGVSLEAWDEAIYAEIAKQMLHSGDWLTPHWNGEPWFEKPPLLIWLTAGLFSLFGVDELWARAVSAIAGVALVCVTFFLARRVGRERWLPLAAAVVLLSQAHFLEYSRFGTTDILLTLFVYLAFVAYLRVRRSSSEGSWLLVGLSIGLGFMTKSVAVAIVPAVIGIDLLLERDLVATLRSRHVWVGVLAATVIVLPWHLLVLATHGFEVFSELFGTQVVNRALTEMEGNVGPPSYYVEALFGALWPWSYVALFGVAKAVADALRGDRDKRLLLLIVFVVLVLYSTVATKLPWYMTPILPALAILVADYGVDAIRTREPYAIGGLIAATFATTLHVSAPLAALLVVALVALVGWRGRWQATARLLVALLVAGPFMYLGGRTLQLLYTDEVSPMETLAAAVAREAPPESGPWLVYRLDTPEWIFYGDVQATDVESPYELFQHTSEDHERFVIGHPRELERIERLFDVRRLGSAGQLHAIAIRQKRRPPRP